MPPRPRTPVTPPADDGQIGVLVFRLDDVVRRLDEIGRRMDEREARFEMTFLPRREYDLAQITDSVLVADVKSDIKEIVKRLDVGEDRRRADRALLLGSFVLPLIVAILLTVLLSGGT